MPRFSIKDMMLAILLVAVGLAMLSPLFTRTKGPHVSPGLGVLIALTLLFGGLATIGAGLFAPFHKKQLGAGTGMAFALAFIMFLFVMLSRDGNSPSRMMIAPRPVNTNTLRSAPNSGIK